MTAESLRVLFATAAVPALLCGCVTSVPVEKAADPARVLDCAARFDMQDFVIGAWCWHDARGEGEQYFDEEYFRAYREAGFNVAILTRPWWRPDHRMKMSDYDAFVRAMEKTGVRFLADNVATMNDLGGPKVDEEKYGKLPPAHHFRLPEVKWMHERYGKSPALIGYWLNDNCGLHDYSIECAEWLRDNEPGLIGWMSTNPNPVGQSSVPMPFMSSQIYPFLAPDPMTRGPEPDLRKSLCNGLENDRERCNRMDMAMWPVIAEGYTPSVLRFQGNACAAYGAQGVWWFTYNRRMRAFFYETAREVNTYLSQTAGPHLLGHRSIGVFHTGPDIPRNALPPAAGELIEAMPEEMLVGVLVPESSFKAGDFTPDGIFVVDKRTAKYRQFKPIDEWCTKQRDEGGVRARHKLPPEIEGYHREMYAEDPPPRSVTIRFGPRIKKVTAVLPNGRLKPCSLNENNEAVMPPLRGGEGVLLKVDAQQLEVLELPRARIQRLGLEWRFATDENKVGTEQKWFSPAFDDSAWAIAREDSHRGWETATGKRYEGDGWCRQIVEIPASLDAKHLYLHFGSVDEECWVYVNGTLVLENTCKALGIDRGAIWTRPFAVDIRSHVQIGGPNLIALRVYNAYGIGGVLLPVHMVASDEPLTAEQITTIVQ